MSMSTPRNIPTGQSAASCAPERGTRPREARTAACRPGGAGVAPPLSNGDPIANIDLIGDPAKNFAVIMKDGAVVKGE